MGKGAGSPPPAPDPVATANAQAAANSETARVQATLNRVNQISPYGQIRYDTDPNNPDSWTMKTILSPEQQNLYNMTTQGQGIYGQAALSQLQNVQGVLSNPFQSNAADTTGAATGDVMAALRRASAASGQPINTDYNTIRQQAIDAANSRLDPELKMQEETLRSRLLNSGITEGSEAWNNAYRQFNNAANDSRQQTLLNAENLAGQSIQQTGALRQIPLQEAGQIGNIAGTAGNLSNLQMQQALAIRDQPLNEAQALLTGSQVSVPQLQNVPQTQVAPTDLIGATNQSAAIGMQGYNARAQQAASANSGMYGLGSAAIAAAAIAI